MYKNPNPLIDNKHARARVLILPILSVILPAQTLPITLNNASADTATVAYAVDIPISFLASGEANGIIISPEKAPQVSKVIII